MIFKRTIPPPRKVYPDDIDEVQAKGLWSLVMIQSLKDLKSTTDNSESWFFSTRIDVGSCRWVCSLLDLNYQSVIKKLPDIYLQPSHNFYVRGGGDDIDGWT